MFLKFELMGILIKFLLQISALQNFYGLYEILMHKFYVAFYNLHSH